MAQIAAERILPALSEELTSGMSVPLPPSSPFTYGFVTVVNQLMQSWAYVSYSACSIIRLTYFDGVRRWMR